MIREYHATIEPKDGFTHFRLRVIGDTLEEANKAVENFESMRAGRAGWLRKREFFQNRDFETDAVFFAGWVRFTVTNEPGDLVDASGPDADRVVYGS